MLFLGETGAGKTYAAERIHAALVESGAVKADAFVSLNCGEFGPSDMNAALFGIEGGKFTDVRKDQVGAIEEAQGGILFLDEIGTLPIELQPRLLTVLDGGKYRMHGAAKADKQAACRFIFGTNENLRQAVRDGRFRFDLYNRISGIEVCIPSVKERIDGTCGGRFLDGVIDTFCRRCGGLFFTNRARAAFLDFAVSHPWRGNFREVNRFFQILGMNSDRRNVVSASVMEAAIEETRKTAYGAECAAATSLPSDTSQDGNPLLADRKGVGANEKVVLSFAFKCAAEAANCQDAGRRFFAGKYRSNHNWHSSFARYLAKFGFRWDKDVPGHIAAF